MDTPATRRALWPQRLHHQLVLMVSLSLLLALGLLGGYTASEQSTIALHGFETQASALARNVAIASSNPLLTDSLDQVEALVLRSADFDEVMSLHVLTPDGHTLSHVARSHGQAPHMVLDPPRQTMPVPAQPSPQILVDTAADLITAWHPVMATKLIAWVRVDYNAYALHELRNRILRNTLIVAVLAISLCAALMALMLRRPMRALNRARQFAIELVSAEGRQMPFERAPLEVMELNAALNEASMLLKQQLMVIEEGLRQRRAHEARLAQQNDQLGAIFAMSQDGLVTFDKAGNVLFANQAFMSLTGLRPNQVIGKTQADVDEQLQNLCSPGSSFKGLEASFAHADADAPVEQTLMIAGEHRAVLTLSGQHSKSESVSRVLYVCDVTRQHTLDQMKSEFLSMAAHELRTPMTSIYGYTELMLKREMNAEQRQDLLGRIYRQCQSMISILNELLDLARIEARRGQDFKLEMVDLADVAASVINDFNPPAGREAPRVDAALAPMPVHVDVQKMQQAVLNVLSNAYKYSPDGGPVFVRYMVADAEQGRHRFAIEIEDQGMGLSPDHLARLGERFFRADKSGNIPGTGLGVSIVKELIELMGGRMHVASELGKGTTVTLWL
jgi:two-component system sensor histidine kinase VicK